MTSDACSTAKPPARILDSADVSEGAVIGAGSSVWHLAQVREDAVLGEDCVVGRGAYIGTGVRLGAGCKVQNYALVYEPAVLGAGVFVGPAAVFTNDHFPRAVNPDLTPKSAHDWEPVGVTCDQGAAIGARAVCVAPVRIGAWAMVAAGATVTRDVPSRRNGSPGWDARARSFGPWRGRGTGGCARPRASSTSRTRRPADSHSPRGRDPRHP
jgi:UDP-3-O-[3-hydroxymyristoyl] glucosamine N-acyltransferase